ncbi:MAG TPA: hypothetical protein VG917_05390, partial [Patescibacteria group bacterium]|nr:hypothetical protein [Patescibacteria group bacterium]
KKVKKHQNKNLVIFIAIILIILICAFIFNFLNKQNAITSTYPSDFYSGDKIITFSPALTVGQKGGISMYDKKTQKNIQLVKFNNITYGNPVLSPDNNKIVYYMGVNDKDDTNYDLWLYDIPSKENKLLASNLTLFTGYTQQPIWTSNSKYVYITFLDNKKNKLYKVDLNGQKSQVASSYSSNIFWPRFINDNYLSFLTVVPCGLKEYKNYCGYDNKIGIIDLKNNKVDLLNSPSGMYSSIIKEANNSNTFIKYNFSWVSVSGGITGSINQPNNIEIISIQNKKVLPLPVPSNINPIDSVRLSARIVCGNYMLIGKQATSSIINTPQGAGNYFVENYVYNLKTGKWSIFNNQVLHILDNKSLKCSVDDKTGKFYAYSNNSGPDGLKVIRLNLANPKEVENIDYESYLPQNMQSGFNKMCLYAQFLSGDSKPSGFAYFSIVNVQDQKCFTDNEGMQGLYYFDNKNSKATLIPNSSQFILPPNI